MVRAFRKKNHLRDVWREENLFLYMERHREGETEELGAFNGGEMETARDSLRESEMEMRQHIVRMQEKNTT
jgi:hypothetical protein